MYQGMVRALVALHRAKPSPEWVAIACLIGCYIDALSARGRKTKREQYQNFLRAHFSQLCKGLGAAVGKNADGAKAFWVFYRSGMAHTYFTPDTRFAIADDADLDGQYAGSLEVPGRKMIGINIERLYRDFVALARKRAKVEAAKAGKKK